MNKIKMLLTILVFLCTAVSVQTQDVVESIVAVVNDEVISLSEYKERHDNFYQMLRAQFEGEDFTKQYETLKNSLMETMITELLLLQEARNVNTDVSEQVTQRINLIKEENGFTSDDQLMQALRQENIAFDAWKDNVELSLLQQAVMYREVGSRIVVDDSELVGFYNQHLEDFRVPEEYTIKGIYVSSDGKSEEEVQAKKQEIDSKIAADEDMSLLAAQYGEGPEKDSQGDLGSFVKGQMLPNMEKAVEGLSAGELTNWIEMPSGWYLLRLEDKKESMIRSFEDVRTDIESSLFNEKNAVGLEKFLTELKERSFIKILNPDPLGIK